MTKQYFVFGRVAVRGNPWALEHKHPFENRADALGTCNRWNRVGGREARLVHVEPTDWTPAAIAELQRRGLLPA
jgi:hypothetical protein